MQIRRALPLLALTALAACDDDDGPTTIANPAFVRVINASAAATTLDVVVDGRVVATDVAFGAASSACVQVPSGDQTLTFRDEGGATVATLDETLVTGERYALVVTGATDAAVEASLVADRPVATLPGGFQFVRFVNATDVTGQIFVTEPDGEIEDIATFIAEPGEVTAFAQRPQAQTRTRFYEGTSTPLPPAPLADFTVDPLPASRTGTVVITGEVEGSDATAFYVERCA